MKQEWYLSLVAENYVIISVVDVQTSEEFLLKTHIAKVTIYFLALPCTYKCNVNLTHVGCEKELWNTGVNTSSWQFVEHSDKWTVLNRS